MNWLFYDCGLYAPIANAVWQKGDNIRYFTPWMSKEPHYADFVIGKNFEHLEKILYFEDSIDWADCIVFHDVHGNAMCNYLRKKYPEKSIFGAGLGERIENDRLSLKKWCESFGLPVNKYVDVKGVSKLREHLKTHKNQYVKINIFRGDMESFFSKDFESVEMILDQVETALGPHKEEYEFICEDEIKTDVEVGFDGFFNGHSYLNPCFVGYEFHKNLYLAHVADEIPEPLKETLDAFAPLFERMNYRGAMSTEEKIVSPKEHYFLDACMRLPNPLSALYPVMIENWRDLVYSVGRGEDIELEVKHKYVGAYGLTSIYADKQFIKVDIEKGHEDDVRLQMPCSMNDKIYSVPGWPIVAILVAGGDTVDEVLEKLKENVKYVNGHGIDKDGVESIDVIKDIIAKGKTVGIPFGG